MPHLPVGTLPAFPAVFFIADLHEFCGLNRDCVAKPIATPTPIVGDTNLDRDQPVPSPTSRTDDVLFCRGGVRPICGNPRHLREQTIGNATLLARRSRGFDTMS